MQGHAGAAAPSDRRTVPPWGMSVGVAKADEPAADCGGTVEGPHVSRAESETEAPGMNEDPNSGWSVYLLECVRADGRRMIYTGITRNIVKRVEQHALGKGAKCLRGVTVLGVVWHSPRMTKSQALKAEAAVKRLAPVEKRDFKLVSDLVRKYAR